MIFILEIEKIKDFIEQHSDELVYEIYSIGCSAKNVTCEINYENTKFPKLTVYHEEAGEKLILFTVYEPWFKIPTKKQLEKDILNNKTDFDIVLCHHWSIHKIKDGIEQFVLSTLSVDDYLKALEIYKKYL